MNDAVGEVDVRLSPLLMHLFPTATPRLRVPAQSVSALIDELDARWPGMGACLRDTSPAIRKHINVFVDGKRVKLDAPLAPGTDVYILTAISGG